MKQHYIYQNMHRVLRVAFLLCLLSSCGGEQEAYAPAALEISAEIVSNKGNAVSRALDIPDPTVGESNFDRQVFLEGDVIGLYIPVSGVSYYVPVTPYKKQGSRWMLLSGNYGTTIDGKTYTAVFPYYKSREDPSLIGRENDIISRPAEDQSTKEKYLMSNKLVAEATVVGNHLSLKFKHAFAKLTVVVNYGEELIPNNAIFDRTFTLCRTSEAAGKVHSYVGIIKPTTPETPLTSWQIEVTTSTAGGATDTKRHIADLSSSPLHIRAGYNYRLTFSATDELILTGVTVLDFDGQPEEDMGSAT